MVLLGHNELSLMAFFRHQGRSRSQGCSNHDDIQVMAWCRQATSHYLSQCWPRSLSPYGVTRPQWVKFDGLFQTSRKVKVTWLQQPWWQHDMDHFLHFWIFVRGIHQSPVDSSHKMPVMWSFDVCFVASLNRLLNKELLVVWVTMTLNSFHFIDFTQWNL